MLQHQNSNESQQYMLVNRSARIREQSSVDSFYSDSVFVSSYNDNDKYDIDK